MEATDSDKHSSLLKYGINCTCKKLYYNVPWAQFYKLLLLEFTNVHDKLELFVRGRTLGPSGAHGVLFLGGILVLHTRI